MSFHTAAYFQDTGGAVVNSQIAALADNVLTIRSASFFLEQDMQALYFSVYGTALDAARLDSPTLRDISRPQLAPMGDAVIPPTTGPRVVDWTQRPLAIPAQEQVALEITDATAVANNVHGVIGLQERFDPAPSGPMTTILWTAAGPAVANAWTSVGALVEENTLRDGDYAVVGMQAFSTTMIAARLNFQGVNAMAERPGCIGGAAQDVLTHPMFRNGRLGKWGQFSNVILPVVEVLCNAADAAFRILVDVVQISGSRPR